MSHPRSLEQPVIYFWGDVILCTLVDTDSEALQMLHVALFRAFVRFEPARSAIGCIPQHRSHFGRLVIQPHPAQPLAKRRILDAEGSEGGPCGYAVLAWATAATSPLPFPPQLLQSPLMLMPIAADVLLMMMSILPIFAHGR